MNTYLNFSLSFLLFFARNLFFSFLSLFPFSVLVFFMLRFVFVVAGIKSCISSGELSNFISSNFQHQLQRLFYVFLNQQRNKLCEYPIKHTPVLNNPARSHLVFTAPFPHFPVPAAASPPRRAEPAAHVPTPGRRAQRGPRSRSPSPERSNRPGAGPGRAGRAPPGAPGPASAACRPLPAHPRRDPPS